MSDHNNKFIVRTCKFNEISQVIAINESTLPENYPTYFYEQIIEKFPESFMVIELRTAPGDIIGYVMWRIERGISCFGINLVKKAHLVSLAVAEGFRQEGAATSLLKKSMVKVKEHNSRIEEFVLEVRVSNFAATSLYQNVFHFKKAKIIEKYYRDGENAYYLALKSGDFNNY
ncbi:MAG: GNAT family N-acetyltransferase [Promethearchaeota archaeon]